MNQRTIKFKVWLKDVNCWADSVCIYDDGSWSATLDLEEGYDEKEGFLCESTGLKDKNGKEIYDHDIVSLDGEMTADNSMGILPNGWTFDEDDVFEVIWDNRLVGWTLNFKENKKEKKKIKDEWGDYAKLYIAKYKNHARGLLVDKRIKIIGNSFETPHLLTT